MWKEEEERKGEAGPGPAVGTGVGGWRQRAGGRTRFSELGGSRDGMSALLLLLEEVLFSSLSSSGLESCRGFVRQKSNHILFTFS